MLLPELGVGSLRERLPSIPARVQPLALALREEPDPTSKNDCICTTFGYFSLLEGSV